MKVYVLLTKDPAQTRAKLADKISALYLKKCGIDRIVKKEWAAVSIVAVRRR